MKQACTTLKRLGPVPFWRGEKRCLPELERMYQRAFDAAVRKLGK